MKKQLQAGYHIECITPDFLVCLSGAGDELRRKVEGVVHDIYTTCVALSDGDKTIVIFTNDLISSTKLLTQDIKAAVGQAVGIPPEQVYITNIHSHSTPRLMRDPNIPGSMELAERMLQRMPLMAKAAIEDMAPAQMYVGTKQLPGMVSVRHYLLRDGTYAGPNFGTGNPATDGIHEATRPDETLMLVRFARQEKKDILLVNWQAHPCRPWEIGRKKIAPDYIGPLRDRLTELSDTLVAYIPGASGNQIMDTYIQGRKHGLNYIQYGEKLADEANELLPRLQPMEGTPIRNIRLNYQARANHAKEHMQEEAKKVVAIFHAQDRDAANAEGRKYGFSSVYEAMSILGRPSRGATFDLELNAFSLGQLGAITGEMEMASTTAIPVRYNSPFDATLVLCRNFTYVPAYAAYDYGAYEACSTPYAQGTAEEVTQLLTEMLCKLKHDQA